MCSDREGLLLWSLHGNGTAAKTLQWQWEEKERRGNRSEINWKETMNTGIFSVQSCNKIKLCGRKENTESGMFWCCSGMNLTYILFTTEKNAMSWNKTAPVACDQLHLTLKSIQTACSWFFLLCSSMLLYWGKKSLNALWDVQLSLLSSTKSLQDFFFFLQTNDATHNA